MYVVVSTYAVPPAGWLTMLHSPVILSFSRSEIFACRIAESHGSAILVCNAVSLPGTGLIRTTPYGGASRNPVAPNCGGWLELYAIRYAFLDVVFTPSLTSTLKT